MGLLAESRSTAALVLCAALLPRALLASPPSPASGVVTASRRRPRHLVLLVHTPNEDVMNEEVVEWCGVERAEGAAFAGMGNSLR